MSSLTTYAANDQIQDQIQSTTDHLAQYQEEYNEELSNQEDLLSQIDDITMQINDISEQIDNIRADLTDTRNDLQDVADQQMPKTVLDIPLWSKSISKSTIDIRNNIQKQEAQLDELLQTKEQLDDELEILNEQLETEKAILNDYEYLTSEAENTIADLQEQNDSIQKARTEVQSTADESNKTTAISNGQAVGSYEAYELTDDELRGITKLCEREQGTSVSGVAAEASLIANRYQKYGKKYGSLYQYVVKSAWWGKKVESHMSGNPSKYSNIEIVRNVICNGNRTLPSNVDEHDCLSDITSVSNNGTSFSKSDRSSYISGVTKIKNRYGATYTFYCFSHQGGDPFGYTGN